MTQKHFPKLHSPFIILFFLLLTIASAQWSTNPGNPLTLGIGIAPQVQATADGDVYIAWLTEPNYQVYLQHLNPDGEIMWEQNGKLISDFPNSSWIAVFHLNLAVDHDGNAIITTVDTRAGDWEVFVWKVAPDGTFLWNEDGLQLSSSGTGNTAPRLTVLPDNSVVVTWNQAFADIKMQRISPEGELLWGDNGIQLSDPSGSLMTPLPMITADDLILVQWIKQSGGWPPISELTNQKFDFDGNAIWPSPLVVAGPVSFPMGNWSQKTVADNSGGAFSSWTEMSGTAQSAKVRHITSDGQNGWAEIDLSTASGNFRTNPKIVVSDDSQELMAVWTESDGGQSNHGISAQRLSQSGDRLWGNTGFPAVPLGPNNTFLDLSASGIDEDIIAVYIQQASFSNNDVFAFRLNASGEFTWDNQTYQLTISNNSKTDLTIVKGPGCNVAVWSEDGTITAHCLRNDGTLGAPIIEENCLADGDINFDGDLNILDIVSIVNFIIGNSTPTDDQVCAADINEDGSIDILDIVQILNIIL